MKKFRFLYIAAAALLFAACANEEDGIGNNGPVAATVQADISNNIKTRGTADNNSWTAGDAIGVYVTSTGNTTGTNVKYEYSETGDLVSANPIYFRDSEEQTFSAYYPYIDDPNNDKFDEDGWLKNDWTIDYSNPSNTLLANDFLFASGATASKASPMVNFIDLNNVGESLPEKDHRFKHKMSMIEFTVSAGEGIESRKSNLQSITLDKIKTQGKINVKTGATEVTGTSSLKTLPVTGLLTDRSHLTTMMITHNMKDAIKYGNRLIMMHEGHIIYDVSGEEKKNLQVSDLLAKFQIASGGEFANDRMILS